jgi:cytochrome c oxidase accessory protein FixG
MCPYARFQSAMFDRDTLIIAYDEKRGEPRGHRKKLAAATAPRGDCVDCQACVQVCPTGIDIRNGLQYECIACGACIDACDSVMDKLALPRGLIRYGSENALAGRPRRVVRPRVLVYGAFLGALALGFAWAVLHRAPLIVDVLRDRNALYRSVEGGAIENAYTLRVMNKDAAPHRYRIVLEGPAAISIANAPGDVDADAEQVLTVPVTLRAAAGAAKGKVAIAFRVESIDAPGVAYRQKSNFFGPF